MVNKKILLALVALVLALSACGGFDVAPTNTPGPSPTITETLSPMGQQTATVEAGIMMAATATVARYTEQSLAINQANAESTLVAAQAQADQYRAEQTRIVAETRAAGTQVAAQETQVAVQLTQAAQATMDYRAWEVVGWTATADANAATQAAAIQSTQLAFDIQLTQDAVTSAAIASRASQEATQRAQDAASTLEAAYIQAESTTVAAEAAGAANAARRGEQVNNVLAWVELFAPYLLGMVAVGIVVAIFKTSQRNRIIPHDQSGGLPLVERDGHLVNPERMIGAELSPDDPVEARLRITENAQKVEAIRAMKPGKPRLSSGVGQHTEQQAASVAQLPSATWSVINQWDGKGIPLGMGRDGLIQLGANVAPHLLVAGTSGSGKTRCGLRPATAAALARGDQAIILDRGKNNYTVFDGHPNADLIPLDEPEQAIGYLQAAYTELQRRKRALAELGKSTLEFAPDVAPRTWIILDEFSNLADELERADKESLLRWARMLAAEGRQVGIYLMLALQDPTARSIDLRIRRNCTCVAFKVQDQDASRVVLGAGGAENLTPGHFLTVIGSLVHGVGFDAPSGPSDEAITQFLGRSRVISLPAPLWINAPQYTEAGESREDRILRLHRDGLSLSEIQRQVFGFTGGAAYNEVRQVILSSTTNDTTTTDQEGGYIDG